MKDLAGHWHGQCGVLKNYFDCSGGGGKDTWSFCLISCPLERSQTPSTAEAFRPRYEKEQQVEDGLRKDKSPSWTRKESSQYFAHQLKDLIETF